jgi:hypothetical protein
MYVSPIEVFGYASIDEHTVEQVLLGNYFSDKNAECGHLVERKPAARALDARLPRSATTMGSWLTQ